MENRTLGATGPTVGALSLGCMGMSGAYGPSDRTESIDTIHAALDAGMTLIDTGDFYGMGHNEMLIADALKERVRDKFQLSVKYGAQRGPDGSWLGMDNSATATKTFLAYTLNRLGVDYIDIYRPARLDPKVESVASLFVSRWDVAVKERVPAERRNRTDLVFSPLVVRTAPLR